MPIPRLDAPPPQSSATTTRTDRCGAQQTPSICQRPEMQDAASTRHYDSRHHKHLPTHCTSALHS
eukprot:4677572-Alexandrium_andersonii.AAC.1